MNKAIKIEKIFEIILGLLFITPAIIGAICFIINICSEGTLCNLYSLSGPWYVSRHDPLYPCLTPVYFGLMAIAGAYMLKNSFRYLFLKEESPKQSTINN